MTSTVRFIEVELSFGCHVGARFELPQDARPVVVSGPNGSGKTSLIEGIVRTLFGFSRRHPDDRRSHEARRPWTGEAYRGRVVVVDAGGARWSLERQFDEAQVEVIKDDPDGERWHGDGNPGASNLEASAYRRRLDTLLGLQERANYESTACIHQGQLIETRLSGELLRVAVGGHGQLNAAKSSVADAHRALTRQPIAEGERGANKPRPLEELESEIAEIEQTLAEVERVERARGPLIDAHKAASDRAEELDSEIGMLAAALAPLGSRRALELERDELDRRIAGLERSRRRLHDALEGFDSARSEWERVSGEPLYPEDFPERVAALGPLWERRAEVEYERRGAFDLVERLALPGWITPMLYALIVLAVAGLATAAGGLVWPGSIAAGLGLVGACLTALLRHRRRGSAAEAQRRLDQLDRRRREIDQELERRLDGVPEADTLSPATVGEGRSRFDRQRAAHGRWERARDGLRHAVETMCEGWEEGPTAGTDDVGLAAGQWIEWIDTVVAESRNALAQKAYQAKHAASSLKLPIGVAADSAVVESALATRRAEHRELRAQLNELERRIMETERLAGSPIALRDRQDACRSTLAELTRRVQVCRRAHALLCDAYDEFRARDQERLIDRVSQRVEALSAGRLGPIEAPDSLEEATLLMSGRPVAFSSPPLSYGEHHAVLLGIRLGAADFLASNGIEPPLIVDDPFVHLDGRYVDHVWSLLCRIAERRQVIVATQDRLVLDHIGVQPDIELACRPEVDRTEPPIVDVVRSQAPEHAGDA